MAFLLDNNTEAAQYTPTNQDHSDSNNASELQIADAFTDAPEVKPVIDVLESAPELHHMCLVCGENFPKHSDLSQHRKTHTQAICFQCKSNFTCMKNLYSHYVVTHSAEPKLVLLPEVRRMCTECGKLFKFRRNMIKHRRRHPRSYVCVHCTEVFTVFLRLKGHVDKVHADKKLFECNVCQKTFYMEKSLKMHVLIHEPQVEKTSELDDKDVPIPTSHTCNDSCLSSEDDSSDESAFMTSSNRLRTAKGFRYKKYEHCCLYCRAIVSNIGRHLKEQHSSEVAVRNLLLTPPHSQLRRNLMVMLERQGNFLKHVEDCRKVKDHAPCKYCKGFFPRRSLLRHAKHCFLNPGEEVTGKAVLKEAEKIVTSHLGFEGKLQEVFAKMTPDETTFMAKHDFLICKFGAQYLELLEAKKSCNVVRLCTTRVRELANLVIYLLRSNSNIKCLYEALLPPHLDSIVSYLEKRNGESRKKTPNEIAAYLHAFKILLTQCCDIAIQTARERKSGIEKMSVEETMDNFGKFKQMLHERYMKGISIKKPIQKNGIAYCRVKVERRTTEDITSVPVNANESAGPEKEAPVISSNEAEVSSSSAEELETKVEEDLIDVKPYMDGIKEESFDDMDPLLLTTHPEQQPKKIALNPIKKAKVKAPRKVVRWTDEQKNLALDFFQTHINERRPPRRREVENLRSLTSNVYQNKTWQQIKAFVHNVYTQRYRKAR